MKRVFSILCIILTLCSGVSIAQAGGGHGHGGWHGGGGGYHGYYHGHYGGCGDWWWPLVGFGVGLGVGLAASPPAPVYYYPAYTYVPVNYAYVQPAHAVAVAAAPAKPATAVVSNGRGQNYSAVSHAAISPPSSNSPISRPAVVGSSAPETSVIAAAAPSRGTWVQDPQPYIYPPGLAPDRPGPAVVGGAARTTVVNVASR